ncbi:MAG TPA: hypothetical protein VGT40_17430 [Methylomirabilota bacterium]|nr:hypothetical protein [Methylomirabilota bacterium]
MKELAFALTFTGHAAPVVGSDRLRQARTEAGSQASWTVLGAEGVESRTDVVPGDEAVLESRVERFTDGSFVEEGTIRYGNAGRISFSTVGRGTVGPSPAGTQYGAVIWAITGGDGRFAGARGLITSNFTVDAAGRVVDHHWVQLYLPT